MDQTTVGATVAGPDDEAEGGADPVMVEEGPAPEEPTAAVAPVRSAPPAPAPAPDRADAPVSEVAERFLRAILQRLPLSRIEEVHLFSPLRQGTVETGIAVVAARPADVVVAAPLLPLEAPAAPETPEAPTARLTLAEGDEEARAAEALDAGAEPVAEAVAESLADSVAESATAVDASTAPPVRRHEVHTARYRLVIKGPERGRWEEDLVAEADAPLITVETVVRGVQRRAGEATQTIRYSAAQVARALRLPFPPA